MKEYERACRIPDYNEYKVLTELLVKAFAYDRFFHCFVCRVIACAGRHFDNNSSGYGRPTFGLK